MYIFLSGLQALLEEVSIPGTDMKLGYLSSRSAGYKSVLRTTLTHHSVPFNLMKVHLMVAVEGRLFRKWFPAQPNLSYDFLWDKTDVYSQKVYGLSEAFGETLYPELMVRFQFTSVQFSSDNFINPKKADSFAAYQSLYTTQKHSQTR